MGLFWNWDGLTAELSSWILMCPKIFSNIFNNIAQTMLSLLALALPITLFRIRCSICWVWCSWCRIRCPGGWVWSSIRRVWQSRQWLLCSPVRLLQRQERGRPLWPAEIRLQHDEAPLRGGVPSAGQPRAQGCSYGSQPGTGPALLALKASLFWPE